MATTKTELLNNDIVVATKTSAPFYAWDWVPSGTGAAVLTYKRYEDDVLVYTSGVINGTVNVATTDLGAYNFTGLYSLRNVNSTYAGPAIKVTRTSDSTSLDIGFDVNGDLDTAALLAFVPNTYIGYVDIFYDQTGNLNHLNFDATGSKPVVVSNTHTLYTINAKTAISFPVVGSRLLGPASLTAELGLSVFTVIRNTSTSGTNKGIFGKWAGTLNEYGFLSRYFNAPNDVGFVSQNASSVQSDLKTGNILSVAESNLYSVIYDGADKFIRKNSVETGRAVGVTIRASDAPFVLGGYSNGGNSETFLCSELAIAKADKTANISVIENNIKTYYGIA